MAREKHRSLFTFFSLEREGILRKKYKKWYGRFKFENFNLEDDDELEESTDLFETIE